MSMAFFHLLNSFVPNNREFYVFPIQYITQYLHIPPRIVHISMLVYHNQGTFKAVKLKQ